jgi:hypothetical protein
MCLLVVVFGFWVVYMFEIIEVEVDAIKAQQEVRGVGGTFIQGIKAQQEVRGGGGRGEGGGGPLGGVVRGRGREGSCCLDELQYKQSWVFGFWVVYMFESIQVEVDAIKAQQEVCFLRTVTVDACVFYKQYAFKNPGI